MITGLEYPMLKLKNYFQKISQLISQSHRMYFSELIKSLIKEGKKGNQVQLIQFQPNFQICTITKKIST